MNYYYNADENFFLTREEKKREIKKLGLYTGAAFVLFIVLQNLLFVLFEFAGITKNYLSDPQMQSAVDILLIIPSIMIPFCFFGKKMKKVSHVREPLALDRPDNMLIYFLAVVSGIGVCMAANIITSFITVFMEGAGVTLSSPDVAMPGGTSGIIITFARVVICATMTEELCLRGFVMGNLRNYGDRFAILMSSVMFAAMHGNLVQAPFALIAGFAIGYFTVKTGSMWTGITIHAANNIISVVITYLIDMFSEEATALISAAIIYGFIIIGGICFVIFRIKMNNTALTENCKVLSLREKCSAFMLNPAMLLAMAYMIYITSLYVKIG